MTGQPRWVATDSSGYIIAALPSLIPDGTLRRTMGRYESQTFQLVVTDKTDPSWLAATREGAGAVIGYVGEPGDERVVWGGIVLRRERGLDNRVKLTAVTPEGYLDGRYTGDYSVTGRDQNLIMSDLIGKAAAGHPSAAGSSGWPFTVRIVGGAGTARDRTYADKDDKTLYSALDDLAGAEGGPQWMTGWEWQHNPERIVATATVGTRVGVAKTAGLSAPVSFTSRMMTAAAHVSDYSPGNGGNVVTAVSSGEGDARPQQSAGVYQPGRPVWEVRFTPSTSITNTATLLGHARARLGTIANGSQVVSCTLARAAAPRLGIDWDLGDDATVTIDGPLFASPITTTAQVVGYDIDADTITPYLAQDGGF